MAIVAKKIFLSFDIRKKDVYQGIYYGHLLDSTVSIGALFKVLKKENELIKRFEADFFSEIIGGRINLGLNDFAKSVKHAKTITDPNGIEIRSIHQLFFSLDILEDTDDDFDPVEIEFDKAFNPETDILQVLPYRDFKERYVNYVDGMLATGTEEINDLRSCDVLIGNG